MVSGSGASIAHHVPLSLHRRVPCSAMEWLHVDESVLTTEGGEAALQDPRLSALQNELVEEGNAFIELCLGTTTPALAQATP